MSTTVWYRQRYQYGVPWDCNNPNAPDNFVWNDKSPRKFQHQWRGINRNQPNPMKFAAFIGARKDDKGQSLIHRIGKPTDKGNGWFRFPVLVKRGKRYGIEEKPTSTEEPRGTNIEIGWHGSSMYSVWAILYHLRLRASQSQQLGDTFLEQSTGESRTHADTEKVRMHA